jgi:rhodanese-related sulfurtransferase
MRSLPVLIQTASVVVLTMLAGCDRSPEGSTFQKVADRAVNSTGAPAMDLPEYRQLIASSKSSDVLTLDVRNAEEWAVSRIPGALPWPQDRGADSEIPAMVTSHLDRGATVVVYCSIGYRSGLAAQRLLADRPGSPIFNLRGGIFLYANEGGPLDGGKLVHGYDEHWQKWLRPELRTLNAPRQDK